MPFRVPLILAGFVAFWCLMSLLISAMGWTSLAARYRTDAPAAGRVRPFASGEVGGGTYRGALVVGIEPGGLRLSVLFLFRIGHPPVLVPWADITEARETKRFLGRSVEFRIGTPHATSVVLFGRTADAVRDARARAIL